MSQGYPPDWDTRRKEVYKRDGYACQNCGAQGGPKGSAELHAHHIVPKSKGGKHKKSNLKTVCKDCHNAIHGETVAPSADVSKSNREDRETVQELPVDISDYPFSIRDQVKCANITYKISEKIEEEVECIDELHHYTSMKMSLLNDGTSDRLDQEYTNSKQDVEDFLQFISDKIGELEELSNLGYKSETEGHYDGFLKHLGDFLISMSEYKEGLVSVYEGTEDESLTQVDIRILQQNTIESIEDIDEVGEVLLDSLSDEVSREVNRLEADGSGLVVPFEDCPLCDQEESIRNLPGYRLVQCLECETDFVESKYTNRWRIGYSSFDIDGYAMYPLLWKKAANENPEIPSDLDSYQQISSDLESKRWNIAISAIISNVLLMVLSYLVGSLILYIVLTIVTVIIARHALRKTQESVIEKEISSNH